MKIPGIIGGLGPEATLDYYRRIVDGYRVKTGDGSYPPLLLNSIDMQRMTRMATAGQLDDLAAYLLTEIERLARAGANFATLSAVTPHLVYSRLQPRSPIPLMSIMDVTLREAQRLGLKRLGLMGSRFTMSGRFFPEVFERAGLKLVSPTLAEQAFIHERYMGELVAGKFLPETSAAFLAIAERLRTEEKIEGLILGGTELPLLLRDVPDTKIPFLDTTRLHVAAIVAEMTG